MKKYLSTFFPQDSILGIDIGNYAIKFVLFDKTDEDISLKNFGYVQLNIPQDVEPAERKTIISEEISKYVKKEGIKTKYAATSVSGNSVITRYIKVPKMDKKELDLRISSEAEAFIPFDINDVVLSYFIINDDLFEDGQSRMELVLVAVKKELIDERTEIITAAGLIPVLIDVDSFAIENVVNFIEGKPSENNRSIMVINIGQRLTNISILVNNILVSNDKKEQVFPFYSKLVRDVFVGGYSIDRMISKKLNLDIHNVDEIKKSAKILVSDEDKMEAIKNYDKFTISTSRIISSVVKELINDINRSIDFFISSGMDVSISKIYLCGGCSSIKNLDKFMFNELKIPIEYINPFAFVKNRPDNVPDHILNSLAVAAGLSLRSIKDL